MADNRQNGYRWGLGLGLILLVGCHPEPPLAFTGTSLSPAGITALTHPAFLIDAATAERYRQEGLQFRQAGSFDRAIATLKIAVALDPLNPNGYVILGWTQHLAGNQVEAAQSLQMALQHDANSVPALNALGIVYLVDGQLDLAVATFQQAAGLKPDNEIAYYNISLAYQRLDRLDDAIICATTATQLEPGNPHPWVALALAYWSHGDQDQAAANYLQAVQLDGRYTSRAFLDHLIRAGFSDEQVQITNIIRQASL